ncbi:hypothetical protein [Bradyrhizobium elkanii]|uniref:hypothetical protein n=1 Tax=Bradyrhizobium elkanii TaxID=29448 RepID=UPI00209EF82F|nr:hypothetical protein [Bradyrhizobium elkanii]MCP1971483.1 hypothetical protein [Bradyrhizobium elkanii]MCS3518639.1 hypothetical protein [Bradyrhizobium elkanii]MCS4075197.1 hypothetical protein [Bradyrhizobium elkanii]MCS4081830.1 hypothetical protein [Bradyrhizobium elkanii]MCS4107011.1 hypothetical protein [Bradyrhizobium elkanii]
MQRFVEKQNIARSERLLFEQFCEKSHVIIRERLLVSKRRLLLDLGQQMRGRRW